MTFRPGPGALAFAWIERATIVLCWIFITVSWTGETLAEIGRFSALGVLGSAAILLVGGAIIARRLRRHAIRPRVDLQQRKSRFALAPPAEGSVLEVIALAMILAGATALYMRPSEAIFATHDAGARLNAAASIATSGGIIIHDPNVAVAASSGQLRESLGTYVVGPLQGIVLPQFSGVNETWLALGLDTINLPASLWNGYQSAPSVFPERPLYFPSGFALMALLVFYLAFRRIFGTVVTLGATLGLALSYPEITYARLTMAEIPTQLAIAIAFFGLILFWQQRRPQMAILSGAAIGIACLTRIDAVLLYVPITAALCWLTVQRRWQGIFACFFVPAGLLLAQGLWHDLRFGGPYLSTNLIPFWSHYRTMLISIVAVGCVSLVGLIALVHFDAHVVDNLLRHRRLRLALVIALGILAVYGYAVRPALDPAHLLTAAGAAAPVATVGGESLIILGRYISPLTLGLALIGAAWLILLAEDLPVPLVALLITGGLYTLVFTWNPLVSTIQPFWVRRYLPVVIPFLVVLAAVGASIPGRLAKPRLLGSVVTGALSLLLVASIAWISLPLWLLPPEYQGALAETDILAHRLPPDSIIIFDDTEPARWLDLPLTFLFHRDAFILGSRPLDQGRIEQAVSTWRRQGKMVTLITSGGNLSLDPNRWGFQPIGQQRFRFTAFPLEFWQPPTQYDWVDFHIEAYKLVSPRDAPVVSFPFTINVGQLDYPFLIRGFSRNDYTGPTSYRFTGPKAVIQVPRPPNRQIALTLRLAGQRPANTPPAILHLFADGALLGTIAFPTGNNPRQAFRDYHFTLNSDPAHAGQPLQITLQANTWRPSDYGHGDTRTIGVGLMRVTVG